MGEIGQFKKEKIIAGIIFNPLNHQKEDIISEIAILWGEVDYVSELLDFDHTSYYQDEMGGDLKKFFLSVKELVSPEILPDIKIQSNDLEIKLSAAKGRTINIDPGFLNQAKLILASTKDFSHRIPLRDGIYAEVTLTYVQKKWLVLPWTFPDFRSEKYHQILTEIRDIYSDQLLSFKVQGNV